MRALCRIVSLFSLCAVLLGWASLPLAQERDETATELSNEARGESSIAETRDFIRGANGLLPSGSGPVNQQLIAAGTDEDEGQNWLYHNRDYAGTRFSPLQAINQDNAASLRPVCIHQVGNLSDFQTGPLVHDGVMYLTSGSLTLALEADTCRQLWQYEWQHRDTDLGATNRGVALADGYVVRGTSDGYLLALDALDGALLWARQVADPVVGEHFTMPPLIHDGRIFIGPAGGNNGVSGWVGAFKLLDGAPLWRFHTVPGALDGTSANNDLGLTIGGGAVWTPMSLDTQTATLFVAVSNPAPNFSAALAPGENLYTNSVIALNVADGSLRWHRQLISLDDHSWDLTQVSPLLEPSEHTGGKSLMATAGKDGLLRVLDRETQEILFSRAVTTRRNTEARITAGGTYVCPGVSGGVLWSGPALVRSQGLLITPAVDLCSTYYRTSEVRYSAGRDYFDGTAISDPSSLAGWLTAISVADGEERWRYRASLPLVAGVTTTAGGLVLTGDLGGNFLALNSHSGELLYRFNTGGAVGGGVISYAVAGRQYIAVASGSPSAYQVNGDRGAPTIVVFSVAD